MEAVVFSLENFKMYHICQTYISVQLLKHKLGHFVTLFLISFVNLLFLVGLVSFWSDFVQSLTDQGMVVGEIISDLIFSVDERLAGDK